MFAFFFFAPLAVDDEEDAAFVAEADREPPFFAETLRPVFEDSEVRVFEDACRFVEADAVLLFICRFFFRVPVIDHHVCYSPLFSVYTENILRGKFRQPMATSMSSVDKGGFTVQKSNNTD